MRKRQCYLFLGVLSVFVLVAFALHYQSFAGPMYYDSVAHIQSKEHLYASGHPINAIRHFAQRPVAIASFYLNYMIWGMDPYFFRLVNVVILALTGFMAVVAFILILGVEGSSHGPEDSKRTLIVGLFLGLVYLVHPIQTYFVAYIWQRMGLLCCFFYISALATYVAVRTGRIHHTVAGYAFCALLFSLALGSKEKAITLPAVLVLAEIAFFWDGWKSLIKRIGVFALILLPLLGILTFLVRPHGLIEQSPGIFSTIGKYYQESGLNLSQVLISQCRVLFSYLALVLLPTPSNVQFTEAHFVYDSPLESAVIAASVLGALVIIAVGIVLIRKRPLTGFGLLFFVVNLMPESFLVPQYLFFGYRANLPSFGLLLIVGDVILEVWSRVESFNKRKTYLVAVASGVLAIVTLAVLSAVTVAKSGMWQDPVAFWTEIVEGLPSPHVNKIEVRARIDAFDNLGQALQKDARHAEAIASFQKALQINSSFIPSYIHMAVSYSALGDNTEAEESLRKAVAKHPGSVDAQFALAEFYISQDRLAGAWDHMRKAAALTPSAPRCINGLGKILLRQGKASEAASYFRKVIEKAPGSHEAHYNLGEAYVSMRNPQEAERHFRKALALKRAYWEAHNSLGLILAQSGKAAEATQHFREALALSPRNWRIHNNLGAMLAKAGDFRQAAVQFEKALEINPEDISTKKNLERVRNLMGNPSAR